MSVVIGLAGVKTSGKSTVAEMVKEYIGGNIEVLESALADKLKNVCAKVFNLERVQFDAQELKEIPFETPKLLDLNRIEEILVEFNVEPTQALMQSYIDNGVEGMLLESPRHIAQIVGTEVLRATGDEDIHCKNMPVNEGGITIVSDLRFPNEFAYFNNNEDITFLPIYIQRDEAEQHVTEDSHPSEKCVFEFSGKCVKLDNNGNMEDLKDNIYQLLNDSILSLKRESKRA